MTRHKTYDDALTHYEVEKPAMITMTGKMLLIAARRSRVTGKICRFIFIDIGEARIGPHRAPDYTTVS